MRDVVDELVDALPNCGECGTALVPAGRVSRPFWFCPTCKVVSIVAHDSPASVDGAEGGADG